MGQAIDPLPTLPGGVPSDGPSRGRLGWGLSLLVLGAYPLSMAVISGGADPGDGEAALSPSLGRLSGVIFYELVLFALWFGVAWFFSRVTLSQLMVRCSRPFLTLVYGFLYSIALRILVAVVMLLTLVSIAGLDEKKLTATADDFRPDIDKLVDTDSLGTDPVYLLVNCTVVSFGLAGFREELWRVAMLAGLFALIPRLDAGWVGRMGAVALVALLFGLGHSVQGAGAVWMTFLLGLGLGGIIVWHRSIWEAVMAHGFFDASTFLMIFALKRYFPELLPLW